MAGERNAKTLYVWDGTDAQPFLAGYVQAQHTTLQCTRLAAIMSWLSGIWPMLHQMPLPVHCSIHRSIVAWATKESF